MSENNKTVNEQQLSLDDGRRVKVLSPGMMVFKRFIRNRLAIVGIVTLIVMFLFSFVGVLFSPYSEKQVFRKEDKVNKKYAGVTVNSKLNLVVDGEAVLAQDKDRSDGVHRAFTKAYKTSGDNFFFGNDKSEYAGEQWVAAKLGESFYSISEVAELGTVALLGKMPKVTAAEGVELSDVVVSAAGKAAQSKQSSFEVDGVTYLVSAGDKPKTWKLGSIGREVGIECMLSNTIYSEEDDGYLAVSYEFRRNGELALRSGETRFEADDEIFTLEILDDHNAIVYRQDSPETPVGKISNVLVSGVPGVEPLTRELAEAITGAVEAHEGELSFPTIGPNGEEETLIFKIKATNLEGVYEIWNDQKRYVNDSNAFPSADHWLGTDDHGMDVLTRLMYGGQISLMVGFVVMLLENLIGIIVGGVSGYFGGWVDTLLMRFVDLFNSIPYYPIMIISGAIMDSMKVEPRTRIFLLMGIMGIMGWTGVARVVRGQILSLREQDFMVATEATGIRISRRIFRHLVPNVMPLLIVQATMGLGGIILTEATLGFLGLGIKYPMASWGSIINLASTQDVLKNYWFEWIPAGLLIVLTVLSFNFVGDGLRDAFDPKMKR